MMLNQLVIHLHGCIGNQVHKSIQRRKAHIWTLAWHIKISKRSNSKFIISKQAQILCQYARAQNTNMIAADRAWTQCFPSHSQPCDSHDSYIHHEHKTSQNQYALQQTASNQNIYHSEIYWFTNKTSIWIEIYTDPVTLSSHFHDPFHYNKRKTARLTLEKSRKAVGVWRREGQNKWTQSRIERRRWPKSNEKYTSGWKEPYKNF